ncbi:MAG: hypothetical protein HYR64_08435 [Fimbriimonas ginsengisoli]|uniref:Uncharacterized protein n=1 Tax=Fimbriimonas ginsengisoli TaxID=1005039 RepID=A0A931LWI9_FIMGI|nr:hypothetical protein [Fimbriimonas ginsengisoli]
MAASIVIVIPDAPRTAGYEQRHVLSPSGVPIVFDPEMRILTPAAYERAPFFARFDAHGRVANLTIASITDFETGEAILASSRL